MLLRAAALLTLAWAGMAHAAPTCSQIVAAASPTAPSEMRAWLLRIHGAASGHNFQGTFVVSGGGNVASARITHFCDGPNQYERIESLDGRQRRVYRHNDVVHTLWPANHVAMIEQRGMLSSFPALLQAGDDGIADWYEVRAEGGERVAGHEANVLAIRARDGLRYGYRLWADRASGLLLRAEVVGERGDVLETSAFSDVVIGIRPQPESVLNDDAQARGLSRRPPGAHADPPRSRGLGDAPAGAGLSPGELRQPADRGAGDATGEPPAPAVIQSIYSDGLTYVSVFIEPYRAARHAKPMFASIGATSTLSQRHGDWWVTIIGDTPPATLKIFAAALERRKP